MMNKLVSVFAIGMIAWSGAGGALAQTATWGGGDGDWTDANWTGGGGAGGEPAFGDNVVLPGSTGMLSVTTDLVTAGAAPFSGLQHQGGVLQIDAQGDTGFFGVARIADGAGAVATLNVDGGVFDLQSDLIIGFGDGTGAGGSRGTVNIRGGAEVGVLGNLDTFFDPGAVLSVTGPDADISVGGFFFVGARATIVANINANAHSPIKVSPGTAAIASGQSTLEVNFVDGYMPTPGTSWTLIDADNVTGAFVNENLPDLGFGTRLEVNYGDGGAFGEVVTVDFDNVLNLKVDLSTGTATIENPFVGGNAIALDGYSVLSASGSLNPVGFTGLEGLGEAGWESANPTTEAISELNASASTTVMTGASFDLGEIFGAPPEGDATKDGNVDIADLNQVRNNFGTGDGSDLTGIAGDTFPFDGFVDISDLNAVRNNFGSMGNAGIQDLIFEFSRVGGEVEFGTVQYVMGGEAVVPEPTSLVLLLAGGLVSAGFRRRTRSPVL